MFAVRLCQLKFLKFREDSELLSAPAERNDVKITTHNMRGEVNL